MTVLRIVQIAADDFESAALTVDETLNRSMRAMIHRERARLCPLTKMQTHSVSIVAAFVALIACQSCSKDAPIEQPSMATVYSSKIGAVDIEVDYAKGADPYTGTVAGIDLWMLFKTNATRLLNAGNGSKTLTVPTTLAAMQELTDIAGTSFTSEQIFDIAKNHRNVVNTSSTASFYVLFLPGYFEENGKQRTDVLGLSFGGTGIIAMFKPVIENGVTGPASVLIEQSTLIHEFGHAVGLVNNGVPLQSVHQDSAHDAHCGNVDCVMYYQNEGAFFARAFIAGIVSDTAVLFDSACLADIDAFASAQK